MRPSTPVIAVSHAAWRLLVGLLAFGVGLAWLGRTRVVAPVASLDGQSTIPSNRSCLGAWASAAPAATRAAIALPAEVREAELLSDLRGHFVRLQAAWDAREVGALHALATPGMVAQICEDWPDGDADAAVNRTDVVTLHAELLGFEALGEGYLATVEFSGLIRESAHSGAAPFRELWMLAGSQNVATDWKLARQQALL